MRWALKQIVGVSALCLGLGAIPGNASESRLTGFSIPCDGSQHVMTFGMGGFVGSTTRFIQGATITVFNPAGVQFIYVQLLQGVNSPLVAVGAGQSNASRDYTGFFQARTDGGGFITFQIAGACGSASGPAVFGLIFIDFFS
jgi:hypothetical protein